MFFWLAFLVKEGNTKESKLSLSDLSEDLVRIGNTFTQIKRLLGQAILTAFDRGVWTHYVIRRLCRSLQSKHDSQVSQLLTTQNKHGKRESTRFVRTIDEDIRSVNRILP